VTTPARTLIDVCAVMSPTVVVKIAQEWMAQRVVRPDDVEAAMVRRGNLRRVEELRRLLADRDILEADSVPEADLGVLLAKHGVPPTLHVLVTTAHGATFELDWAYPDAMVGLELDGYGVHLRSADAFDGDRDRRNELVLAGWEIFNFSSRMCRRNPARVVDQVRRALAMSKMPP
jgi:hypothetical protein